MKRFFSPNIGTGGRIMRAVGGGVFVIGGFVALAHIVWLGILLLLGGAFMLFEAFRGWCLMRACGIRTKL